MRRNNLLEPERLRSLIRRVFDVRRDHQQLLVVRRGAISQKSLLAQNEAGEWVAAHPDDLSRPRPSRCSIPSLPPSSCRRCEAARTSRRSIGGTVNGQDLRCEVDPFLAKAANSECRVLHRRL